MESVIFAMIVPTKEIPNAIDEATLIPHLSFDINIESGKGMYAELNNLRQTMTSVEMPAAK